MNFNFYDSSIHIKAFKVKKLLQQE